MKLVLHIERVVVDGIRLDASERDELSARLALELTAALAGGRPLRAALASGAALDRLAAPPVPLDATGNLGSAVAASLATAIVGPTLAPAPGATR